MALPALTSYLFALDTTHVWRVCAGGLTLGLLCFLTIVWGHTPRAHAHAHTKTSPSAPLPQSAQLELEVLAGSDAESPSVSASPSTAAVRTNWYSDSNFHMHGSRSISTSLARVHVLGVDVRGGAHACEPGINVTDVYGIGLAPDDPNIDWVHYRALYGQQKVRGSGVNVIV